MQTDYRAWWGTDTRRWTASLRAKKWGVRASDLLPNTRCCLCKQPARASSLNKKIARCEKYMEIANVLYQQTVSDRANRKFEFKQVRGIQFDSKKRGNFLKGKVQEIMHRGTWRLISAISLSKAPFAPVAARAVPDFPFCPASPAYPNSGPPGLWRPAGPFIVRDSGPSAGDAPRTLSIQEGGALRGAPPARRVWLRAADPWVLHLPCRMLRAPAIFFWGRGALITTAR